MTRARALLLRSTLIFAFLLVHVARAGAQVIVGQPLPRWSGGQLDIHQISTGRGNAALMIFPDGTTLLVDAGATGDGVAPESDPHPDGSRTPGEWIARYLLRHIPDPARGLDYALITHFHIDHMGHVVDASPVDPGGTYRLAGITDVGTALRIHTMIDRGWPDYSYPAPLEDPVVDNYRAFLAAQNARGLNVERFRSGASTQIRMLHAPRQHAGFEVRNIVGNGELWTGTGASARPLFPDIASLPRADWPTENMCSLGIRITYGAFSYYTGGDQQGTADPGFPAWHAVEPLIAPTIGPVDVHVVSHHGSPGAASDAFLETLASKVVVIPSWAASHPGPDVLKRIVNNRFPPAERLIFATDMRPSARTVIGARADALAAPPGHIIVRVDPGGERYNVIVTSNEDERDTVLAVHGPFEARP